MRKGSWIWWLIAGALVLIVILQLAEEYGWFL